MFGLVTAGYLFMQLIEYFEMDTDAPEPCYEVPISPIALKSLPVLKRQNIPLYMFNGQALLIH